MHKQDFWAGLDANGFCSHLFCQALLAVKLFFFIEKLFEVESFDAVIKRCVLFDIQRQIVESFRSGVVRFALQAGNLVLKFATE
jgi:hypothetical protein